MKSLAHTLSTLFCTAVLSFNLLPFVQTKVYAATDEVEPNNNAATAQQFPAIGTNNPINASIGVADDRDWYRFTASAGEEYVIEIFNASASLGSVGGGQFRCNNNVESNTGLGLVIYDASATLLKSQCTPRGAGNVHNILEIKISLSGAMYIQVIPGSANLTGTYSIRILPKYGNSSMVWDPKTFEPNNRAPNAYKINLGAANALQVDIEERIINYSTNDADVDWYRFDAVAGRSYVIEVFNAAASLGSIAGGQFRCNGNFESNTGLGLIAYDASVTILKSQCTPRGAGNVHNILEINVGLSGTVYVQVIPGSSNIFGSYSIRVLPKHDDPAMTWDGVNFEPNNRSTNAYKMNVGSSSAISAGIEGRVANYSTNDADVDWYRFEANADQIYIIEILGISPGLNSDTGGQFRCNNTVESNSGLGLVVYDESITVLKSQCRPKSKGNIHNFLEIKPGISGTLYVQVVSNSAIASGMYSIRVRPANEASRVFVPIILK